MNRSFDDDDVPRERRDPEQRSGRVTFDDRGNAVWYTGRRKRLTHPALSLADDQDPPAGEARHNRVGLKKGYNPYESGLLEGGQKEAVRKKKDLAALSKWIALKKSMDGRGKG